MGFMKIFLPCYRKRVVQSLQAETVVEVVIRPLPSGSHDERHEIFYRR